jgi:hypothetical protein
MYTKVTAKVREFADVEIAKDAQQMIAVNAITA